MKYERMTSDTRGLDDNEAENTDIPRIILLQAEW